MEDPRIYLYVEIRFEVLITEPIAIRTIDNIVMSILKCGEYFLEDSGG